MSKMYDNITGRAPVATDDLGYISTGNKASDILSKGTTDYNELTNKPTINNVELKGNKTSSDLGLQPTIDSTHKLSPDNISFTESQSNAINSGITETLTEQITTNQNNISFLAVKGGGYNYAKIGTNGYTNNGITLTFVNGVITISGTANATFSLYISGKIADNLTADSKLTTQLPTQVAFTGAPNTENKNRIIFALYNGDTWVYSGSTTNLYHDLTGMIYDNWVIYLPIVSGNTYNGTWRPMIIDKSAYDSGFTDFQPYAPSNAELYAMIQALQ